MVSHLQLNGDLPIHTAAQPFSNCLKSEQNQLTLNYPLLIIPLIKCFRTQSENVKIILMRVRMDTHSIANG